MPVDKHIECDGHGERRADIRRSSIAIDPELRRESLAHCGPVLRRDGRDRVDPFGAVDGDQRDAEPRSDVHIVQVDIAVAIKWPAEPPDAEPAQAPRNRCSVDGLR